MTYVSGELCRKLIEKHVGNADQVYGGRTLYGTMSAQQPLLLRPTRLPKYQDDNIYAEK